MSATPYLISRAAKAVAKRIENYGLTDPSWFVQLLPVCLPDIDAIHYVLRYYATVDAEEPFAHLHFMSGRKGGKSAEVVEQLQDHLHGWGYGEFQPNSVLMRSLPTRENRRRYKLSLLVE